MSESIHGHEIMQLVHEANPPLSVQALRDEAAKRWGEDATFHACAGGGMDLDGILQFLASRGKVLEVDGVLRTNIGQMCDHE